MRHRVVWVRATGPADPTREWWPVYWPAHADPEIGPVASYRHCHVAWNRLAERPRLVNQEHLPAYHLAGLPIFESWIREVDYSREAPIVGTPFSYAIAQRTIIDIWGVKYGSS